MGAVSIRLMPYSSAERQVAMASFSGTSPHSLPPMAQVPRPMRETCVLFRENCSIANRLQCRGAEKCVYQRRMCAGNFSAVIFEDWFGGTGDAGCGWCKIVCESAGVAGWAAAV